METPHTDHLKAQDFEHVYEPAEDSFLLLDALEDDLEYLEHLKPAVMIEIGSGSGIIITALAKKFKNSICISTDINPFACRTTKLTAKHNGTNVEALNCSLLNALRPQSVDVLVFNPPYVVTSDEELNKGPETFAKSSQSLTEQTLIYSWAGGLAGRRIIDATLEQLDTVLTPNGVFYLLVLRENKPDELILLLRRMKFEAIKFKERRIPGEYLYILKITRSKN